MNKLSTTGKISLAIQLIAGLIIVILAISKTRTKKRTEFLL